mgnify:CR=1 FL=1
MVGPSQLPNTLPVTSQLLDDGRLLVGLAILGTLLAKVAQGAIGDATGAAGDSLRGPVSPELLAERERRLRRIGQMIPVIDGGDRDLVRP